MIATLILAAEGASQTRELAIHFDGIALLSSLRSIAAFVSMVVGIFFMLAGTLGVLRLPDFYTRIHAAGMTDTLGAEMILIGLMIQSGFSQMTLKLLFVAFFLLLTGPTATHAVANAAHRAGLKPKLGPYSAPSTEAIMNGEDG